MQSKTRTNVTPAMRRKWLSQFDEGKTVEEIARREKRDSRTVSKHLKKAAEEQQVRAARQDQIRDALAHHSEQLLKVIESLSHTIGVTHNERLTPIGVFKGSSSITYQHDGCNIDPDTLEISPFKPGKLLDLVKEHLSEEQELWSNLRQLDAIRREHIEKCITFGIEIAQRISGETGLEPAVEGSAKGLGFHESMLSYTIRKAIEKILKSPRQRDEDLKIIDSETLTLRYGGASFVTAKLEHRAKVEKAIETFNGLIAELSDDTEARGIARLEQRSDDLASVISDRSEDIAMFPYLRGSCRVCKEYSL